MPLDTEFNKFRESRFDLQSFPVAAPAAGVNVSWVVPVNTVVQLLSAFWSLGTDAGPGVHWMFVQSEDLGGNIAYGGATQFVQPGNTSYTYHVGPGTEEYQQTTMPNLHAAFPLIDEFYLKSGWTLHIGATSLDPTDQLANPVLHMKIWTQN